jgi:Bifunctional DNA primase/polymerase, N-terminal/AAA domain/Primase C terminal 2 (PriCT-2)
MGGAHADDGAFAKAHSLRGAFPFLRRGGCLVISTLIRPCPRGGSYKKSSPAPWTRQASSDLSFEGVPRCMWARGPCSSPHFVEQGVLVMASSNSETPNPETSEDSTRVFVDAALLLAANGWPVFPCNPLNKKPLTEHGFKDATLDETVIKSMWTKWPMAMIGVPTGKESGFWVVDLDTDTDKNGVAEWDKILQEHPDPIFTRVHYTPRTGRHLLFRYDPERPVRNSTSKIAPGIDVRGDGGYVIVPPSKTESGKEYSSNDVENIAEAPDWLYGLVESEKKFEQESKQDNTKQPTTEQVRLALRVIPNVDLGWDDWNRIGMATWRATNGNHAGLAAFVEWSRKSTKHNKKDSCNDRWKAYGKCPPTEIGVGTIFWLADQAEPGWRAQYADEKQARQPRRAFSLAEWLERELPPPDYLLGNLLTTTSRILLYAPTGIGKTMFVMAMSMAAAHDKGFLMWPGVRAEDRPEKRLPRVLFIDGEMSRWLLQERLRDESKRLGTAPATYFILSREDCERMPPLNTSEGQRYIDNEIKKIGGVDFIVFDNISTLIVGDQREPLGWSQTFEWVLSLTKRGIGQLWVHHTGHDESHSYGDKTREFQMYTVMQLETVKRPDTDVSFLLKFQKARERKPENRTQFENVRIALVDNQWIYSRISGGIKKAEVSPLADKFFSALQLATSYKEESKDMLGDVVKHEKPAEMYGCPAATIEQWQRACVERGLITKGEQNLSNSARALFSKYKRELIAANWIAANETHAWVLS